jgi:hypothetical protein
MCGLQAITEKGVGVHFCVYLQLNVRLVRYFCAVMSAFCALFARFLLSIRISRSVQRIIGNTAGMPSSLLYLQYAPTMRNCPQREREVVGQFESTGGITVQVSCQFLSSRQAKSQVTTTAFMGLTAAGCAADDPQSFALDQGLWITPSSSIFEHQKQKRTSLPGASWLLSRRRQ